MGSRLVDISRSLNWRIRCDWNNAGGGLPATFPGAYDDISARIEITRGITATRGRDPSRSLGEPRVPAMEMVGINFDKFFSNDFPSSPIYQKATSGRPIDASALVGDTYDVNASIDANSPVYVNGTETLPIFTGYLDRVTHQAAYQERRVTLRSLGSLIRLIDRTTISTALYTNITTGAAMAILFNALGVPTTQYVISGTGVVLKQWWLDRADPYSAAIELLKTEGPGAALYEDEWGRYIFEGQTYRIDNARSLTPQASFHPDTSGGAIQFGADFEHEDGADAIINAASYHVKERIQSAATQIFSYDAPSLTINPSQTRFINFYADDPLGGITSPLVSGTDFVLTSGTLTQATVVQQNANLCVITLTAGAGGAVLTGLQVRGLPYKVANEYDVANAVITTPSILQFGQHAEDFTGRSEIDPNAAISICDTAVQRYQQQRAVNRIAILGTSGEYIRQGLVRQVSDRVHFRESQTGQDFDAWIESKEYRALDGLLVTILGIERTIAQGYGRYDSAQYDVDVYGQ